MDKLALVILNYNCSDDTIKCVNQLQSFNSEFIIIIVDNNSTDDSVDELKRKLKLNEKTCFIENDYNGGYNYGNNVGIKYALKHFNVDTIGILNPDVIIPSFDVLLNMYNQLNSNSQFGVIGGNAILVDTYNLSGTAWSISNNRQIILKSLNFWNRLPIKNASNNNFSVKMLNDSLAEVDCVTGCYFLIKVEVLLKINFFDENVFLYNEENILGIQLRKLNYNSVLSMKSFYFHNHNFRKELKKMSLKKKMARLKVNYQSRKYLIKTFYPKYLLPILAVVNSINICDLLITHLKEKIKYR